MPDRILASTVLCAVAACGGRVTLHDIRYSHLIELVRALTAAGSTIEVAREDCITIESKGIAPCTLDLQTAAFPGFATDAGPLLAAAFLKGQGRLCIHETIFESRYACASEWQKLGGNVQLLGSELQVEGSSGTLYGAKVEATDLRGGAALVIAALSIEQETFIEGANLINRGYEDICKLFRGLGARLEFC